MQTVISTLFEDHDLGLVAIAAFVCVLSSFAGMTLFHHARRTRGGMRAIWLVVAAISVGFGIWSTHFVAMMAFRPGLATGYDIPLTLVSLAVAFCLVGGGMWFVTLSNRPLDAVLGGAVTGLGISTMHYVGMSALLVGGEIIWAPELVASSILLGMLFGALAVYFGTRTTALKSRLQGTLLLTLAIVAMHFTGMGAADLSQCFAVVSENDATPDWMSLVVATSSVFILLATLGGLYLDLRERARIQREGMRMRGLANAAVEGLIVVSGEAIVTANSSFLQMVGLSEAAVAGQLLARFLGASGAADVLEQANQAFELELTTAAHVRLPVEVIGRPVDFAGKPHVAVALRDLSARKSAEEHIRFLAHHDALTSLQNRASFNHTLEEELQRAKRRGGRLAVMCLDLDRFKQVNDLFGHPAGDALLKRAGDALVTVIGGRGTAARLGGDEFAILVSDLGATGETGSLAEAVLDAFAKANDALPGGPAISASIGIALFPEHGASSEELLSNADTALYRAKQDGRGVYRQFHRDMGAEVRDRRELEHDLRHAVSRDELRLVYQPQIDILSGEVTGFEALIRWRHPVRGEVSPSLFIPVAEDSGLILQIGEWVLRKACAEAATWTQPLGVSVNVSTVQIHAPGFSRLIEIILEQTGLTTDRLEIEVTETALVRDMGRAVTTLREIQALGVKIAMDDFGTGYSSLANLRAFPFSKIKVDQSFIKMVDSNEQSAAIVRAVLGLGRGLGVPVIAEGVERCEEMAFLEGERCDAVQGYLLSRPEDISSFAEFTSGRRTKLDRDEAERRLRLVG